MLPAWPHAAQPTCTSRLRTGELVATTSRLLVNRYFTQRRRPMDAMVSGCSGSRGRTAVQLQA